MNLNQRGPQLYNMTRRTTLNFSSDSLNLLITSELLYLVTRVSLETVQVMWDQERLNSNNDDFELVYGYEDLN